VADVELNLKDLTVSELIAIGDRLAAGLEGNTHFPEPRPTLGELRRLVAELEAADAACRQQRVRLNSLKTARDSRINSLNAALQTEAAYVQKASDGDPKKIMSANLKIEHKWNLWPFGSVNQVVELSANTGDDPGAIDLVWDPIRDADGYEVEISQDIAGAGPWQQCATTAQSKVTIKNLVNRTRYWFRVRAVSGKREGDWSDPVTKFAR